MRVVIVSKESTDYSRVVEEYIRDFKYQTGHDLEVMDPESRDGVQFCTTYDIVEYPSVIALSDGGIMQNTWRGLPLPTIMELSYYAQSN